MDSEAVTRDKSHPVSLVKCLSLLESSAMNVIENQSVDPIASESRITLGVANEAQPPVMAVPAESSSAFPATLLVRAVLWLIAFVSIILAVPYLAEEISYAIVRGRLRAEADSAKAWLNQIPESENRYRHVIKTVFPGVVGIETVRETTVARLPRRTFPLPDLREESMGSGVIVDPQGYIVTSLHVVEQAKEITVRLADGRLIKDPTIVGTDPLNDLAVLKIPSKGLMAVPWGDSDELEVGDTVLAIGNPYGLTRTVTAGIVSAKERRAQSQAGGFQEFLQTDAAMNPGNSGGPLVNLRGEIVGINSAIYGEAYRGISFAIPSRVARHVYEQIRRDGQTRHGWLGVQMGDVDETTAQAHELDRPRGALILSVLPGSPAESAGIQPGDIIVSWDGKPLEDAADLGVAVARTPVGSEVTVELRRGQKKKKLTVRVGQRPM